MPRGDNKSERNGQWKGDAVGYSALHEWVKNHLPKPEECQNCREIKPLDLANISQEYKRDLTDWEWLCRKCHMGKDGRAKLLRFTRPHSPETREKLSQVSKGRKIAPEVLERRIGRKRSPELCAKMKEAAKNRPRDESGVFITKSAYMKQAEKGVAPSTPNTKTNTTLNSSRNG